VTDRGSDWTAHLDEAAASLRGCCDFCGIRLHGAAALYPTRPFASTPWNHPALRDALLTSGVAVVVTDSGGWAACPTCDRLVRSGRRDALAARGAKRAAKRCGLPLRRAQRHVRAGHDLFWAHRDGPPSWDEEPSS